MRCPLCDKEMSKETYENTEIDICPSCGGVWLDKDELERIVDTEDVKFTPQQVKDVLKDSSAEKSKREELMHQIMDSYKGVDVNSLNTEEILNTFRKRWGHQRVLKCPKCGADTEEFEYAGTGVMLDRCVKGDGFWLDKGELEKMQIMMEYYKKINAPAAVEEGAGLKVTEKNCPVCKKKMVEKEYEGVPIDICSACGGVWLDKDELYQIIEKREVKFSEEEKKDVEPEAPMQGSRIDMIPELNCPLCGAVMRRFTYAGTSGVVIDRCPKGDGVWLDKGELEKIQIYIEKSEDLGEKNYAKYSRILNQAKLDYEKRRDESIQNIKVSRFETVNRMMRWMARKMD